MYASNFLMLTTQKSSIIIYFERSFCSYKCLLKLISALLLCELCVFSAKMKLFLTNCMHVQLFNCEGAVILISLWLFLNFYMYDNSCVWIEGLIKELDLRKSQTCNSIYLQSCLISLLKVHSYNFGTGIEV